MGDIKLIPRIRERRMEKHMTQKDLAEKIGMNVTQLSKIETGKTADPSAITLWTLALGIGCRVDDLYEVVYE